MESTFQGYRSRIPYDIDTLTLDCSSHTCIMRRCIAAYIM